LPPHSPRKPDPSRVFETHLDEAKPAGFRRYINLIAIVVPILIGLVLVIAIARSLNQPASPAASSASTTPAARAPAPPAAATPAPSPTQATKPIAAAPSAPPATQPAAQSTANTSAGAILTLPPEAVRPMKISGEPQPCAIANLTGAHGTVVLDIIIAKTGAVEDVKSVSGPPLLHNCAVTAVKTFRYQPQPVRIHTQVVLVYQTTAAPQSK